MRTINVGLIGLGTIGSGVARVLKDKRALIRERSGVDLRLAMTCDVRGKGALSLVSQGSDFVTDYRRIIGNSAVDIVVELIGGFHPAYEIIQGALKAGQCVVTANKALLATRIDELMSLAHSGGRGLQFEASVCGGIPIIKSLRESLVSNQIDSFLGIINGTSNYLLSRMSEAGLSFRDALVEAQKKGYAERNPRFDVEGIDAAHKLVILCYLLFSKLIPLEQVFNEGIADISELDLRYAERMGCVIKPLAIAKKIDDELEARVHPTLLPRHHMLAAVGGVFNAALIQGDMIGDMLFFGRGAGQMPTASAVISDLVDLGRKIACGFSSVKPQAGSRIRKVRAMDDIVSRYYLRFMAIDKPGILAKIAGILGRYHIGIAQVSQREMSRKKFVPVVMITHRVQEKNLRKALFDIERLAIVKGRTVKIRMEEGL